MIEVERKREVGGDAEKIKARLAVLGYREAASSTEADTYYSRPDVDFLETVECLRVRRRPGFAEITYKPASTTATRSADGVIAKRETNLVLPGDGQAADAEALLEAIGMVPLARVEKARASYQRPDLDGVTVAVDTVTGAGVFVEVEVIGENAETAAILMAEVEQENGLDAYPVVALPYRDLVLKTDSHLTRR
ncbi:class IV adenylate cyclase [Nocardiopsis composta]|uniref:Adenylate cyclase class 2 n=1 Tax=Nocardiopsis composta TaxID=157465 RepID=A0A7W8VCS5_9ACTN|nr:class IV adenylate cyclase [Nocardiopsis composta]MBB5431290.1 adenylate cyclase class 2 [Nocardiopsis composta]